MILLDGKKPIRDATYAQIFNILKEQLTIRLADKSQITSTRRIAIVLTKGEQGTVWNSRRDISGFLKRKFPNTIKILRDWSFQWNCPIEYFVCSAFGVIPDVNTPNVKGGAIGIIRETKLWIPFGLVSPLYWLYTGKHDDRLNDIP